MDILTDDYKKIDLYFAKLLANREYKKIILFDFDNQHGQIMYNLIKNPFHPELENIDVIWEKIDGFLDLENKLIKYLNEEKCVFSFPIAWSEDDEEIKNMLEIISLKNIIIGAFDEKFNYPWSYPYVITSDKNLHWATQLNGFDHAVTGTSSMCMLLSIIALGGLEKLNTIINYV